MLGLLYSCLDLQPSICLLARLENSVAKLLLMVAYNFTNMIRSDGKQAAIR